MTTMPFGKYQGEELGDVPAEYLVWLYEQGLRTGDVKDYIEKNLLRLRQEAQAEKQYRERQQKMRRA